MATPLNLFACDEAHRILKEAFGIYGGAKELEQALWPVVHIFEEYCVDSKTVSGIVHDLLKALCADQTMADKVTRQLFVKLKGNADLRGWVLAYRPDIQHLVSDEQFNAERGRYQAERARLRVQLTVEGLETLATSAPPLGPKRYEMVGTSIRKLRRMEAFKQLHEILHRLQLETLLDLTLIAANAEAEDRRLALEVALKQVEPAVNEVARILALVDDPEVLTPARALAEGLEDLTVKLGQAITADPPDFVRGRLALGALVRRHMTALNEELADTAESVPYAELKAMLAEASAGRPEGDDIRLHLTNAADALEAIGLRILYIVALHKDWQMLDSELWILERSPPDSEEAAIHRQDAVTMLERLKARDPAALSDRLQSPGRYKPQGEIGLTTNLIQAARLLFGRVDTALLVQCREVVKLAEPLKTLLET